jgi:hypothetical protein
MTESEVLMKVRAKMVCVQRDETRVLLRAVTDEANKTWAKYTPSGQVELWIDNPDARNAFEIDKHYFVDFTEAPAAEAAE